MEITFLGAAGTVTGSKYLVENKQYKYLIDCGLFQGLKDLRKRNWQDFPIDPKKIDAIALTHAHIDHSGYVPKIYTMGYKGPIYTTAATKKLLEILLPDSGHLQEEEAFYANKKGFAKHHPALPLYTQADAQEALKLIVPQNFHRPFSLKGGETITFYRTGHILGAAFIILKTKDVTIGFSGDVGRYDDIIMSPPENLPPVDYLVVESTYGDRKHEDEDVFLALEKIIKKTIKQQGTVLIPSFAVGRAQLMLYIVNKLKAEKRIENIPIYLDSPMALDATELYCQFSNEHKLNIDLCTMMNKDVHFINSVEESKAIKGKSGPKIIISASGMLSGGRVVHHLSHIIDDSKNTVVLVGFQAAGTRGRALKEGIKELKMFGEYYNVKADIQYISSLSAHADYTDIIRWLRQSQIKPKKVFITHGELSSSEALCIRLQDTFKWQVTVPKDGQKIILI